MLFRRGSRMAENKMGFAEIYLQTSSWAEVLNQKRNTLKSIGRGFRENDYIISI